MTQTIKFHKLKDPHGYMSNFYPCEIELYKLGKFASSEHLYQALKYYPHDMDYFKVIQFAPNAWNAAKFGRNKDFPMRKDWDGVKDDAMRYTLINKFEQHKDLAVQLMETGESLIVEHAPHGDFYWGDGGNGKGLNMLGQILMEVRQVLIDEEEFWSRHDPMLFPDQEWIPVQAYKLHSGKACGIIREYTTA